MFIIDSWVGGCSPYVQTFYRLCCATLDLKLAPEYYLEARNLSDLDEEKYYRAASPTFEKKIIALLKEDFDRKRAILAERERDKEHFARRK